MIMHFFVVMIPRILEYVSRSYSLVTGRNEVVAKVMFLQVCVCPQGGGGCLPQCMLGCHTPPGWRAPPGPGRPPRMEEPPPPGPGRPSPGWRAPPGPGRPPGWRTPPLPPGKQTPAYGLRAAGTHPTGMHSCFRILLTYRSNADCTPACLPNLALNAETSLSIGCRTARNLKYVFNRLRISSSEYVLSLLIPREPHVV